MEVKVLGTTNDVTECECCGRQNLKMTVALSFDDAEAVYYGTTCAARATQWSALDIKRAAREADKKALDRKSAEMYRMSRERDRRLQAGLDALAPEFAGNRIRQFEALGGLLEALARVRAFHGADAAA